MKIGRLSGRVKDGKPSWIFLAVSCFVMFLTSGTIESFTVLVVVFMEYFDETNAKIGWLGSITFALLCVAFPVAVFLSRRLGFQVLIFGSGILITTGYIVTPFMPSVNYVYFTYSLGVGFGIGCVDCLSIAILPEFFDKHLGLATGIRLSSIAAASILFNFMVPILVVEIGWQKLFYCFSSVGPLIILYSMFFRTDHPEHREGNAVPDEPEKKGKEVLPQACEEKFDFKDALLRDRGLQLILIGCMPYLFAVLVPAMFMVAYAKSLGYALSQSKWLMVARGIGSLAGRLTMGYIGDFSLRRRVSVHIACAIVAIFGLACALCSLTRYLPLMILFMAITGLLEGMFWVLNPLMMHELAGGANADYGFSLVVLLVGVAFFTGPSSMGQLYDATGDFRVVLYILSACGILSAIIIGMGIHIRERKTAGNETSIVKQDICSIPKNISDHSQSILKKQLKKVTIYDLYIAAERETRV
ncbi:monocarboxylate transporter 8-like [Xenia sp. Carnegie-2017]|uniref:monocarboxylate transporter 8-like n=1 Tax=Xenia sp. Carnegie-2017 TaxID=2897299 RepID=UPI001F04F2FC|nr:monocarboxylate transporter 8-like [Xenia sp. Carnegie-2017]